MGKAPTRYEVKVRPLGASDLTGAWCLGRTGNVAFLGFFHWRGS